MKNYSLLAIGLLATLPTGGVFAQVLGHAKTADEDWNGLFALTTPKAPATTTTPGATVTTPGTTVTTKTLTQVAADRTQQAQQARTIAAAASSFQLAHAGDPRTAEAKKIEVIAGLQGVLDNDKGQETAAIAKAQSYRTDKTNAPADRFDAALAVERLNLSRKLGSSQRYVNSPADLENLAEQLHAEFGDLPAADNFYIGVARTADMTTAARMATKLGQWPAPPDAKAEAQLILSRQALLRTTLHLILTSADGATIDLAQQAGKLTVILAAPTATASSLGAFADARKVLPKGAQVLYYVPQATAAALTAGKASLPVPGTLCSDPYGSADSLAQQLKLRHFPYTLVLNQSGKLAAFGPASDLASQVATALTP